MIFRYFQTLIKQTSLFSNKINLFRFGLAIYQFTDSADNKSKINKEKLEALRNKLKEKNKK